MSRLTEAQRIRLGKPTTTVSGRVVYDRKRHFLNLRTIKRMLRAYLVTDDGEPSPIQDSLQEYVELVIVVLQAGVAFVDAANIDTLIAIAKTFFEGDSNGREEDARG